MSYNDYNDNHDIFHREVEDRSAEEMWGDFNEDGTVDSYYKPSDKE